MNKKFLTLSLLLACALTSYAYDGTPFNGPHTVPCTVQAEDFDEGGEGVSYHVTSPGSSDYRPDEVVKLGLSNDVLFREGSGNGDWLNYTIEVTETGNFVFDFTWAIRWDNNSYNVTIDDTDLGIFVAPYTGDYDGFATAEVFRTHLEAGTHVVKVTFVGGVNNRLDKFKIREDMGEYIGTPYSGSSIKLPENGEVQAEEFDLGPIKYTYYVSDQTEGLEKNAFRQDVLIPIREDGGYYVILNNGDWTAYSLDITEGGDFSLVVNTKGEQAEGKFNLYLNDILVAAMDVNPSDDWNYLVELPILALSEGEKLLKIEYEGTGQLSFKDLFFYSLRYDGLPYNGPHVAPGVIQAEDYDTGGQNVSYNEIDPADNTYRTDDGKVGIQQNVKFGHATIITGIKNGEWWKYSIEVPEAGEYAFDFTITAGAASPCFTVEIDSKEVASLAANTGGSSAPGTKEYFHTYIEAGSHVVTILAKAVFQFDKFKIHKYFESYPGTPYSGTALPIPGTDVIKAAEFDLGVRDAAYYVKNTGNGGEANSIRKDVSLPIRTNSAGDDYVILGNTDWTAYSIDVTEAKNYSLRFVTNAENVGVSSEERLVVYLGNNQVASIDLQQNAGWNDQLRWGTLILEEGQQLLKVEYEGTGEIQISKLLIEPFDHQGTPFGPNSAPCIISALDFDYGGEGVAYYDPAHDKQNIYREDEHIDIGFGGIGGETPNIGYLNAGEWFNYTFQSGKDANYDLWLRISAGPFRNLSVRVNGEKVGGVHTIDYTGATPTESGAAADIFITTVAFHTGNNVLTLITEPGTPEQADAPGGRINGNGNLYKVTIDNSTGIKTVEATSASVYAAEGKLYLQGFSGNVSLNIYSLAGQKVAAYEAVNNSVPVSLAKGVYIVKVLDKGKTVAAKIIVK